MSAVPADLDTTRGPPTAVPARHFFAGLACLVAGTLLWVADAAGWAAPLLDPARLHLLLAGWVCLTIMGAMTQFVPVWSGRHLHSRRLARVQLWLAAPGVIGLATAFAFGWLWLLPPAGVLLMCGIWLFVYNIARTLPANLDVTEAHFAFALGAFLLATALGATLAVSYTRPALLAGPVTRSALVGTHVTLAVFGGVVATVIGALYQLATMFTQTEFDGYDRLLQRLESGAYPVGVIGLAGGRLLAAPLVARVSAGLLLVGVLAFAVVLGRRLLGSRTAWGPLLQRYAVATLALVAWIGVTGLAWLRAPLARETLLGGSVSLLLFGVIGFVIVGTLYHVIPFLVWDRRYADRLGLEPVPGVDDLYDARIAAVDGAALVIGTALLGLTEAGLLPALGRVVGGIVLAVAALLVGGNLLLVVADEDSGPLRALVARTLDQ